VKLLGILTRIFIFIVLQLAIFIFPLRNMTNVVVEMRKTAVPENITSGRYDKCMERQVLWSGDAYWWQKIELEKGLP
jgi:hypothetical protein